MTITLRSTKGSALTYAELDANFTHLRSDIKTVQNITGPGVISLDTGVTLITTTGANAYTLGAGQQEGQIKIISMKVDGGNATLTFDNFINGSQVVFNATNDTIILLYQSTGWVVIARQNATVS